MSVEALGERKYSTASDVWAFGVLLYEIYSDGARPYGQMGNEEVISKVAAGYRLERPPHCPETLYFGIMVPCWHTVASKRPGFPALLASLQQIETTSQSDEGSLAAPDLPQPM